jgi:hypothetical protein
MSRGDRIFAAIATAQPGEGRVLRGKEDAHGVACQRRPVSWRAMTKRWISLVPS